MKSSLLALSGLALVSFSVPMFAASVVTVDENGHGNVNGTALTYQLAQDPGPGGLPSVLTYNLPFTGVFGDVELLGGPFNIPMDVIRFNANGTLAFYAAGGPIPNTPNLADQPRPPAPVPNTVQISLAGSGDTSYTPTSSEPGYDGTATPTYHFITSTTTVTPEPATNALLLLGGAGLLLMRWKIRKSMPSEK